MESDGASRTLHSEGQRAGAFERDVEGEFVVVLAGVFERGDLEQAGARAEAGNDDLPAADSTGERELLHQHIGLGILKDAFAGEAGVLLAGAVEQFAPAADAFRCGDVDGGRIDDESFGAQAGDGDVSAIAVAVELEEEVFAFLGGHGGEVREVEREVVSRKS